MPRGLRLLIGYGLQAMIVFFAVVGLILNVGGIRDKISAPFAHDITKSVLKHDTRVTPSETAIPRHASRPR